MIYLYTVVAICLPCFFFCRLSQIVFTDYDREMVLVAVRVNTRRGDEIAAVGRLTKYHNLCNADFGIIVSDRYQGQGLGREMLSRLITIGHDENIKQIRAFVRHENFLMISLAQKAGFNVVEGNNHIDVIHLTLSLENPQVPRRMATLPIKSA